MPRKKDSKPRREVNTTKQGAEPLARVRVDPENLTESLIDLAPAAEGLKSLPAADVALVAARLDILAEAYAARGLEDLREVAATLRDLAGIAEHRGENPLDNPALGGLSRAKSRFQDAFDAARDQARAAEGAEDPLGHFGAGIPRNTHAESAPGVSARPNFGASLRGRAGGIAGRDWVSVEVVTSTGTYIVTGYDSYNGVLTQNSEHADGSSTVRTVTELTDGTVKVEIHHYDSDGVFSDRQVIKIPPAPSGGGTAGSHDPNADTAGADAWLVRAMMEVAARIRPPSTDVRVPIHVNPGPEGGTPRPEGSRLRPGDELVVNPSPDEVQGKDRTLDREMAERLRGTLKSPDPGPRPAPGPERK